MSDALPLTPDEECEVRARINGTCDGPTKDRLLKLLATLDAERAEHEETRITLRKTEEHVKELLRAPMGSGDRREWRYRFAAAALQGMLANPSWRDADPDNWIGNAQIIAPQVARWMVAELEKKP